MSVIITEMEMPKSCGGCRMSGTGVCNEWINLKGYEVGQKRADSCPLKSIAGLIERINEYLIKEGFGSEYRNDVVEIIKEYCEEEQEE